MHCCNQTQLASFDDILCMNNVGVLYLIGRNWVFYGAMNLSTPLDCVLWFGACIDSYLMV